MVEQSGGHNTYSPRPAQMVDMANSRAYLALGPLDFEQTWGERMRSAAPEMKWIDLSQGIGLIEGGHAHHDCDDHMGCDPHYWLSPKGATAMVENMAREIVALFPEKKAVVDSMLPLVKSDISVIDAKLDSLGKAGDKAFMIYHPALSYIERDYGIRQFEIEKGGSAPSPQSFKNQIDEARLAHVGVVFVQQGFGEDKVEQAAQALGAHTAELSPEAYDWLGVMKSIINELQ